MATVAVVAASTIRCHAAADVKARAMAAASVARQAMAAMDNSATPVTAAMATPTAVMAATAMVMVELAVMVAMAVILTLVGVAWAATAAMGAAPTEVRALMEADLDPDRMEWVSWMAECLASMICLDRDGIRMMQLQAIQMDKHKQQAHQLAR